MTDKKVDSLILVDFTEQALALTADLPPGITLNLMVSGYKVYVQYSVRIMVRGKRLSLGTFLSRQSAIEALVHAKTARHSVQIVPAAEINQRMELQMKLMSKKADDAVNEVAKPRVELSDEMIEHLLLTVKGLHVWQVFADSDIDVTDEADITYTITKEQQSAWLARKFPKDSA